MKNSDVFKGDKMYNTGSGMISGMTEFFKEYKGCRNCIHQPEPLTMCDYGKNSPMVTLICPA